MKSSVSRCHEGEAPLRHRAGKLGLGKADCSGGLDGIPHSRDVGSVAFSFFDSLWKRRSPRHKIVVVAVEYLRPKPYYCGAAVLSFVPLLLRARAHGAVFLFSLRNCSTSKRCPVLLRLSSLLNLAKRSSSAKGVFAHHQRSLGFQHL